jgi:hypothetical protein
MFALGAGRSGVEVPSKACRKSEVDMTVLQPSTCEPIRSQSGRNGAARPSKSRLVRTINPLPRQRARKSGTLEQFMLFAQPFGLMQIAFCFLFSKPHNNPKQETEV